MAAYMISPLISNPIAKSILFLVVSLAAGIYLGWIDRAGKSKVHFVHIKRIAGILIILSGIGYFYSAYSINEGINWVPYDESLLLKAEQEGRPVILDFYADWCIPCKEFDKTVFRDEEVVKLSKKFITMHLDLTKRQANQDKILEKYKVIGVPTVIFINKDGKEERSLRMESLVGRSDFLLALKRFQS
jgi:thioredoxin:protein disulfide reductase